MEPVTLTAIAAAIAAGASAALKDTAAAAVKDAYDGVKSLLRRKYADVDLSAVEKKPDSETKRGSLAEDLADAGATGDAELREHVRTLVEAVERHAPEAAPAIGVDLEKVRAAFIRVDRIRSTGTGFRGREMDVSGGIDIGSVEAGGSEGTTNP